MKSMYGYQVIRPQLAVMITIEKFPLNLRVLYGAMRFMESLLPPLLLAVSITCFEISFLIVKKLVG